MADLVTRLQASADYVDDMKTRVRDGALTIFEEGSQKLFREAATALSAVSTENARLEKAVKDLSDEIDNLEEEGCGVDDTIRKLSDRATAAEAAIARLRDEVIEVLRAYHDAYSDYRFAPEGSWEKADASGRLEDAHDLARAALRALKSNQEPH